MLGGYYLAESYTGSSGLSSDPYSLYTPPVASDGSSVLGGYYLGEAYLGDSGISTNPYVIYIPPASSSSISTVRGRVSANDYGAKLSQERYDVKDAQDYKLTYSSSWPLLKIFEQGRKTLTTDPFLITTHGLGYVPMFWAFATAQGATNMVNAGNGLSQGILVNESTLVRDGGTPYVGSLYYYIFAIDLERDYKAPNINTGIEIDKKAPRDKDFGLKVSLPGYSVFSSDLRHFAVHSGTRSPMLHQVVHGSKGIGVGSGIVIDHNLGHEPMFFVYAKLSGRPGYQLLVTTSDVFVSTNKQQINVFIPYACDYSVVILKDPMRVN